MKDQSGKDSNNGQGRRDPAEKQRGGREGEEGGFRDLWEKEEGNHGRPPVPLNPEVRHGAASYCFSYPLRQEGFYSAGIVNRFFWQETSAGEDRDSIDSLIDLRANFSNELTPGSSGSPLIDEAGNVMATSPPSPGCQVAKTNRRFSPCAGLSPPNRFASTPRSPSAFPANSGAWVISFNAAPHTSNISGG